MPRKWKEVRARAISEARLDDQKIAAHKGRLLAPQLGYELAQRRQNADIELKELPQRLQVPAVELTYILQGQLDRVRVATLRAYISSLGGKLRITVRFGDEHTPSLTSS